MNGLSIIVLSKNDKNLCFCFAAFRSMGERQRLIVVDDGLPLPHFTDGRYLPGEKPFIFARNANLGIRAAGRDDVILLNDDAQLETRDGFTEMQLAAEEHPEYGVIAAATNVCSNPRQRPLAGSTRLRDAGKAVAFVCVLIPRRTIDLVGLLDERFTGEIEGEKVYGGEDTDYCYRVRKAGLKIGVFDGCYVDHSSLESTFRPGNSLPINAARARFREIHGVEMEWC